MPTFILHFPYYLLFLLKMLPHLLNHYLLSLFALDSTKITANDENRPLTHQLHLKTNFLFCYLALWQFNVFTTERPVYKKPRAKAYLRHRNICDENSFEAVSRMCSAKKVFLKISQNSQENICARASFLIKLQASSLQLY